MLNVALALAAAQVASAAITTASTAADIKLKPADPTSTELPGTIGFNGNVFAADQQFTHTAADAAADPAVVASWAVPGDDVVGGDIGFFLCTGSAAAVPSDDTALAARCPTPRGYTGATLAGESDNGAGCANVPALADDSAPNTGEGTFVRCGCPDGSKWFNFEGPGGGCVQTACTVNDDDSTEIKYGGTNGAAITGDKLKCQDDNSITVLADNLGTLTCQNTAAEGEDVVNGVVCVMPTSTDGDSSNAAALGFLSVLAVVFFQ